MLYGDLGGTEAGGPEVERHLTAIVLTLLLVRERPNVAALFDSILIKGNTRLPNRKKRLHCDDNMWFHRDNDSHPSSSHQHNTLLLARAAYETTSRESARRLDVMSCDNKNKIIKSPTN